MIKIERDFDSLAKNHFDKLKNGILDKMKIISSSLIKVFFNDNLDKIICSKPDVIFDISNEFNERFKKFKNEKFKQEYLYKGKRKNRKVNKLTYIFDYDSFKKKASSSSKYDAYKLAKKLNINVCPYCNRNYTNTVFSQNGKKVVRPEFDHFFSQKNHPLLVLSFYNLIPSCHTCNHIKGSIPFSPKTHFHPYFNGFEDDISFNYLPKSVAGVYGVPDKYSIIFEKKAGISKEASNRLKGSSEVFQYEAIYEQHSDILEELVEKIYKGGQTYLDSVRASFPSLNLNDQEMYRIAYGNYMDDTDHEKRPFAKLTKDIFDKLGPDLKL